jgi:hypothetical protein
MIVVTFLAGISFLPRVVRTGFASTQLAMASPALKQLSVEPGRKLPLRGRIWGTFIPPWPNYGRTRRETPADSSQDRRNRNV